MNKLIHYFAFASLLLCCSCSEFQQEIDDLYTQADEIRKTEDQIKDRIDAICKDIDALNLIITEIQKGGYVKSLSPINDEYGNEAGYILTLSNGETLTINYGKNGSDGVAPVVGVKKYYKDGLYYWTVDGEFVLDSSGSMIRADGITPMFDIKNDFWYISYDGGVSWTMLGSSVGSDGEDGARGDQLFYGIEYVSGTNVVTFILADGTKLVMPCYQAIAISFDIDGNLTAISAGETIKVNYTLSYGNDNTVVTVSSDGHYSVELEKTSNTSGIILITCPGLYADGHINVMAFDGVGYASVAVINFYEKQILLTGGEDYYIDTNGGNFTIPVSYNFAYYVESGADWISVVRTKGSDFKSDSFLVNISKNNGDERIGYVYLFTVNSSDTPFATLTVHQSAAYFNINNTSFLFASEGGNGYTDVNTSRGVSVVCSDSWFSANVETVNEDSDYRIVVSAQENKDSVALYGSVDVYDAEGTSKLAVIDIIQMAAGTDEKKDIVFRVKASKLNDYTVYLPINRNIGEVRCAVDWGDGTIETVQNGTHEIYGENVYHKYDDLGLLSREFEVTIKGKLSSLNSNSIPYAFRTSIVEVKQWGNTGLTNMEYAFDSNVALESVPADECLAFHEVYSFYSAFKNCARLANIDENLFRYSKIATGFSEIFSNCRSLTSIPAGLFSSCSNAVNFNNIFSGCSSLTSVPDGLFRDLKNASEFSNAFYNCNKIESVGKSIFKGCSEAQYFYSVFNCCRSLKTIPNDIFDGCCKARYFNNAFQDCDSLKFLSGMLFASCNKATDFQSCFNNCINLSVIPEDLLSGCHSLSNASWMFSGIGILEIPSNLFSECYELSNVEYTFQNCSSLKSIPVSLFNNCTRINNFQGTFAWCWNVEGESPYTLVDSHKVHLYERSNYPDYFACPVMYDYCFSGDYKLIDYELILSEWKR